MGFGPFEINPNAVLTLAPGAGNTVTQTKYGAAATPAAPGMTAANKFFSTVAPSAASQVDWAGTAAANWQALPGSTGAPNGLASSPTYTVNAATDPANHPALWTAMQRAQFSTSDANGAAPRAFPLTDLRLFAGRYSGKGIDYTTQTFLANTNRAAAFQTEFASGSGVPQAQSRALVTPFSTSFAKGGLAPNWFGSQTLGLAAGAAVPALTAAPQLDVSAIVGSGAALSDERQRPYPFGSATSNQVRVQNLRAALGAVNLNRPLADYRGTNTGDSLARVLDAAITPTLVPPGGGPAQPSAAVVPLLETAAWNDRQQLAADIFLRLCSATGARVAFDENIPADPAAIPAGAKLPYSDNQTRFQTSNNVPNVPFRRGYVLPQPTGYNAGTFETTYTLALNPVPQPTAPAVPVPGSPFAVTKAEYDAVRYLAQLAVNIVDGVDADDVSTCFVWNPAPVAASGPSLVPDAMVARNTPVGGTNPAGWPNSLSSIYTAGTFTPVEERAVFGVEKPRLVINEAYAEVANDSRDIAPRRADRDFRVRFWLELLNPSMAEQPNTLLAGPDGTGAVPLVQSGASVYRVQVFDKGTPVLGQLAKPGNVTGAINAADPSSSTVLVNGTPTPVLNTVPSFPADPNGSRIQGPAGTDANRLTSDFTAVTPANPAVSGAFVEANNGQGAADATAVQRRGFAVVGPNVTPADKYSGAPQAFVPDTTAGQPFNLVLQKAVQTTTATATSNAANALDYYIGRVQAGQITNNVVNVLNADANRHAVLLQRLANPYLPFDPTTNPFLTVDVMSQVEVHDAIQYGTDSPGATHTPRTEAQRFSVGRAQPFAGYQDFVLAAASPQYQYPTAAASTPTLTVRQTGTVTATPPIPETISFFRHNSQNAAPPTAANDPAAGGADPTILTPFEWLAHFDRPLVNQLELLHATALPAHQLTRQFMTPTANSAVIAKHTHDLQHQGATSGSGPLFAKDGNQAFTSPLYRALDLLQAKRQLILQGVPGTGKTHVARALARHLTGDRPELVSTVQFHPAYSYEEFVEGIRPKTDGAAVSYLVEPGVLLRVAEQAARHPADPHVLLVDEINRGNLPRVFGELLYLLEYRDQAVTLPYSKAPFRLPPNLFLLATLNPADRSVTPLDQATRRRFAFLDMPPDAAVLSRWLARHPPVDADPDFGGQLVKWFERINQHLTRDFGPHRQIGHAYWLREGLTREAVASVWDHEVRPALAELFVGNTARLDALAPSRALDPVSRRRPIKEVAR